MTQGSNSIDDAVDALKREAREATGLDDFGGEGFEVPLRKWVQDLAGPQLNEQGRQFLTRLVLSELRRRLRVVDCLARNPEIDDVRVPPIVLITGYPRTGTTLLHNLMAAHPRARALLRWELMRPTPPPTKETHHDDPRIARVQATIEPLRGTPLEHMHWINADEPEECAWGFYDCTGLLGWGCWGVMPTWGDFLWKDPLRDTYSEYRKLIQLLTWKNPLPEGDVLVLKAPQTVTKLQSFAEVFPEAKFVLTHRDPGRAIVSAYAVTEVICAPFTSRTGGVLSGDAAGERRVMKSAELTFESLMRAADSMPERVVNLSYADLTADPLRATRDTFEALGLACDERLDQNIEAFVAKQRSGHRKKPPSTYTAEGYDPDSIRQNPVVRRYCEKFAIPDERTRVTDVRA